MRWEPRGVHSRFYGTVTAADLQHHVEQVIRHPDFSELRFSILDFREAVDAVRDADLLNLEAQLIGAQFTNSRVLVAAVTSDPDAIDHLNWFVSLGILLGGIQVFATPEAAMDWIAEHSASNLRPG